MNFVTFIFYSRGDDFVSEGVKATDTLHTGRKDKVLVLLSDGAVHNRSRLRLKVGHLPRC